MEQLECINDNIEEYGYGFFAVERKDNGQFIGFTLLTHRGFEAGCIPCVEIGWRLNKENRGFGFATEAAKASLGFGFNEFGFDEIYSFTSIRNSRSESVMRKIGMKKEGYFEHPMMEDGHFLKTNVLYKIENEGIYQL